MGRRDLCKQKMEQAINKLNEAKALILLEDYEQAEDKLADALEYIADALDCLQHMGGFFYASDIPDYLENIGGNKLFYQTPDLLKTLLDILVQDKNTNGGQNLVNNTVSANQIEDSQTCIDDIDRAIKEIKDAEKYLQHCKFHKATEELIDAIRFISQAFKCINTLREIEVEAGPNQSIVIPDAVSLNGAVTINGAPATDLNILWSKVSGPGDVIFADPTQPVTTASFNIMGEYVLRLTASDNVKSVSDDVTVNADAIYKIYTTDADFNEGKMVNLDRTVPNELLLDDTMQQQNFIWVAVSTKGTIVKINTDTGEVMGEYATSPDGQPKNPSRTTVDLNGSVWATNRDGNSVVCVCQPESGLWIDKNGNGKCDTSTGLGDVKPWTNKDNADTNGGVSTAEDECIIHYTRISSSGARHVSVDEDNNVWASGTNERIFDLIDGETGEIIRTEPSVGYGGYGGLIDPNGVIWSARPLLRWDTDKSLTGPNGGNWTGYNHDSYGLAIDSQGNVWNTSYAGNTIYKFAPDGSLIGTYNHGAENAQGCVVDKNDDVWIAHSLNGSNTVGHIKNDGKFVGNVVVGDGPTGVAVDSNGKIWATNYNSCNVSRIDPNKGLIGEDGVTHVGEVDFTSGNLGGNLYNYSDMTGSTLIGLPSIGTWTTIFDSERSSLEWGAIRWNGTIYNDGLIKVFAASSDDGTTFSPLQNVQNQSTLSLPAGRYLKVVATLKRSSDGKSPVLTDITVGAKGYILPTVLNKVPIVEAGADAKVAIDQTLQLQGEVSDDCLPDGLPLSIIWDKVSGPGEVTFNNSDGAAWAKASFGLVGEYQLRLTASDSVSVSSDIMRVTVTPKNLPPVVDAGPDQNIVLPDTASLNGSVVDDGIPGTELDITWREVSGPSDVTFADPKQPVTTASFTKTGQYVLRLTASDSMLSSSDDVTINVDAVHRTYTTDADFIEGTKVNLSSIIPDQLQLDDSGSTPPSEGTWTVIFDSGKSGMQWGAIGWNGTVYNDGLISASIATDDDINNLNSLIDVDNQSYLNTPAGQYLKVIVTFKRSTDGKSPILTDITVGGIGYKLPDAVNKAPLVNAGPDITAIVNQSVSLNGEVSDDCLPDGKVLNIEWSMESGPEIVNFADFLKAVTTAVFSETGEYVLTLNASDSGGTYSSDSVNITVISGPSQPDYERPAVQLIVEPVLVNPGQTVNITVNASDNIGVVSRELKINGASITLDAAGKAAYIPSSPGTFKADASAFDAAGNEGNDSGEFIAITSGDTTPPVISFSLPEEGSKLYLPTTIIGTAADENFMNYKLEYSEKDKDEFIEFASGNSSVTENVLGTFDPTLLRNGLYDVKLTAIDTSGNVSSTIRSFQAEGEAKVGNFSMDFNDITIPVSGIPITVVRSYDSRNKSKGDFGIGWTLSLQNISLSESCVPGENWEQTHVGDGIPTYYVTETRPHIITVTYPNGTIEEFHMTLYPESQQAAPIEAVTVSFTAEPGTFSTLEALPNNECLVNATEGYAQLLDYDSNVYNPNVYRLTTKAGTVMDINQSTGVESITDNNGNKITFNTSGIIHSSGKSISFERDVEGRITSITDPMGNKITYLYDFYGDLVQVTDQGGNTTRFTYNSYHQIVDIIDSRGIMPARNIYDEEGRLIAQIDSNGNRTEYAHDLNGKQELIKDRLGNVSSVIYDEKGNVLIKTDKLGNTTEYTYDSSDNMLTSKDPLGNITNYTYDDKNNKLSETDPLGHKTEYTYNSRGQVMTIKYPNGEMSANNYDSVGNLAFSINRLGNITSYNYDSNGNMISLIGPMGEGTQYTYDQNGFMTSETSTAGITTNIIFDGNGNQLEKSVTIGSDTTTTKYVYDSSNRLIETINAYGYSRKTEYNSIGKKSAEINEMDARTEYRYDDFANLTDIIYPDGAEESYSYDAERRMIASTDRGGRTIRFEYDKEGKLLKMIYPDNTYIENLYDAKGQLISTKDGRGNISLYAYDEAGHNVSVIDALGNETRYEYNENDKRVKMIDAKGNITQYLYDAEDHLIKTIFNDGTFIAKEYNNSGRMISKTDQAGKITRFNYNDSGRLISVVDALNDVTNYEFDAVDRYISQTDANGHKTQYQYDKLGRIIKKILPLGDEETFSYDPCGNLISKTDFNGNTTTFEYETNGWMTKKSYADGKYEVYTYTPTGKRSSATDNSGTTTYQYDYRDRMISQTNPDGSAIFYSYDGTGNCISLGLPSGIISSTYDSLNRLSTVTDPLGNITSYTYDPVGNLASGRLQNGVTTAYEYDSLNRLTRMTSTDSSSSVIESFSYTLGPSGNRTKVIENTGRTVDYSYDDTYKLIEESIDDPSYSDVIVNTYSYDAVGNRLSKDIDGTNVPYTYDNNDRLLAEGSYEYSYDSNGNTKSKLVSGLTTNYTYDYNNRLIKAETSIGEVYEYAYNVDGIRVQKKINNTQVTNYLVDSNRSYAQVLEERDGSGTLQAAYVSGNSMISQTRGSDTSYYLQDALDSTRILTDGSGIVKDKYTYDAFGALMSIQGSTQNDYLFTGEQYDLNLEMYYLRARYMNPVLGRFVTPDQYEGNKFEPLSLHKYLYANANPVSNRDPSGNETLLEVMETMSIESVLNVVEFGITVMNYIDKAIEIADFINSVISVYNMISSGDIKGIADKIYSSTVEEYTKIFTREFWENAGIDLLANSGRIVAGALSKPDKINKYLAVIKKSEASFLIFMPTLDKVNYNIPLMPTGISLRGKSLRLAFGTEEHPGRVIGFGAAPTKGNDNLFQIFRMDYHEAEENNSDPILYWESDPFHYHIYNA